MTLRKTRGAVLIIVVGLLAVLAVLASTFTALMRLELSAARNFSLGAQAELLAQAGVQYAVQDIRAWLSAGEMGADDWWKQAPWMVDGLTKQMSLNDPDVSGEFALKVIDAASKIYLSASTATLTRAMLQYVNQVLDYDYQTDAFSGSPPMQDPGDIDALMTDLQQNGGYLNRLHPMDRVPLTTDNDTDWARIAPYVSTHGWIDGTLQRFPVNLNTAGKEVIAAMLWKLQAVDGQQQYSMLNKNKEVYALAMYLAGAHPDISNDYRPYQDWTMLHDAVVAYTNPDAPLSAEEKAMVLAALMPHHPYDASYLSRTRLEGFGVDGGNGRYVVIGKSQLDRIPCDACLFPPGYFEIESTGRVRDAATGQLLAERQYKTTVKLFDNIVWARQGDYSASSGLRDYPLRDADSPTDGWISLSPEDEEDVNYWSQYAYDVLLTMPNSDFTLSEGSATKGGSAGAQDCFVVGARLDDPGTDLKYTFSSSPLGTPPSDATLGFWFRPDWEGNDGNAHSLVRLSAGGVSGLFLTKTSANQLTFSVVDNGSVNDPTPPPHTVQIDVSSAGLIEVGRWYYLEVSWQNLGKNFATDVETIRIRLHDYNIPGKAWDVLETTDTSSSLTVDAIDTLELDGDVVMDDFVLDQGASNLFDDAVRFRVPDTPPPAVFTSNAFQVSPSARLTGRFSWVGCLLDPALPENIGWQMTVSFIKSPDEYFSGSTGGGGVISGSIAIPEGSGVDTGQYRVQITSNTIPDSLTYAPTFERAVLTHLAPIQYLEWVAP